MSIGLTRDEYEEEIAGYEQRIAEQDATIAALREQLARMPVWEPIETAPNDTDLLVAYNDLSMALIAAARAHSLVGSVPATTQQGE